MRTAEKEMHKKCISACSPYQGLLEVPKLRRPTQEDRAFRKAAPELWNKLPNHVRNHNKLESFKKALKTHLFDIYGEEVHLIYAK